MPTANEPWTALEIQREKLRMAHDAAMLHDSMSLLKADRESNQAHQSKMLDQTTTPEQGSEVVNIGDKTEHNYPPQGIGTKGIIGIAAASALLPMLLAGYLALKPAAPAQGPLQPTKVRLTYKVEDGKLVFRDPDGNVVDSVEKDK